GRRPYQPGHQRWRHSQPTRHTEDRADLRPDPEPQLVAVRQRGEPEEVPWRVPEPDGDLGGGVGHSARPRADGVRETPTCLLACLATRSRTVGVDLNKDSLRPATPSAAGYITGLRSGGRGQAGVAHTGPGAVDAPDYWPGLRAAGGSAHHPA